MCMKSRGAVFWTLPILVVVFMGAGCGDNDSQMVDNGITTEIFNQSGEEITVDDNTADGSSGSAESLIDFFDDANLPDPIKVMPQAVAETGSATDFIKKIQADVVLTMISSNYIGSLSDTRGLNTNYYIFTSEENPEWYYLVNVPRDGGGLKRFIMPKEDFSLDFQIEPIPFQFWNVNYASAMGIAEKNGGKDFRIKHNNNFETALILAKPIANLLSWHITYDATDGTGDRFKISINANTGEIQPTS